MTATLLRAGFVLALVWAAHTIAGQEGEGAFRLEIRDRTSGQIVPAMVCITSTADGKWRTPPDGRAAPPYTTTRAFYDPPPWQPGDIGPVRLTNGEFGNNDVRSSIYEGRSAVPYWQEPAAYFVSQPFTIRLPAGKWRLAVARGIEYLPVFEEFTIQPGENRTRTVALSRWADMPSRGWYSGDDHVHHPRLLPEHSELLMTWARAEDVHVMNILRMGDLRRTYFEQATYGKESRYQRDDYILVTGQEDPRTDIGEQGHTIALNIRAPARDTARYHLYDFMFDAMREQGAVVGYAHKSWALGEYRKKRPGHYASWDSSINVPRGKVDFFEILQFRKLGLEDYYDFLNLGYRLTASAGSDVPWGNTVGEARVYAYTGRAFSADAWFAALKQGRTFVTNGPLLDLRVDGAMPGDDLKVAPNARVRVRVKAWAPAAIGAPRLLEVVAHGRVIRAAESSDPSRRELGLEFTLPIASSRWIAARVSAHNGALAHTSPVYVLAGDARFWNRAEAPRLAEERLRVLDYIDGYIDSRREYAAEAAQLKQRVEQARAIYREMAGK